MSAVVLLLGGGVTPAPSQTTLSPTNKSSDIILSNGNLDAESNLASGGGIVLSVSGKTTGKFYAEMTAQQFYATDPAQGIGLHRGTSSLTTYIGGNANGWATWMLGAGGVDRLTYTNATQSNQIFGQPPPFAGIRARFAVDVGAGQIWLSYFDGSAWIGGGDPAAGTSPTYSWTPDAATYYMALCPRRGHVSTGSNRNKLRLEVPADWAFAPPTGFGVWTN